MENESAEITPLSDILRKGRDAETLGEAQVVEQTAETKPEATVEAPKDDTTAATSAASEPEPWTKAAYQDEKRKRQALEARIAEFEAKQKGEQPGQQGQGFKVPDPVVDPEGYRAALSWEMRVTSSETQMRLAHPDDYDAMSTVYANAVKSGDAPMIPMNHPSPATFAYQWGKKLETLKALEGSDLTSHEKKLREKWDTERAEAEAKAKADAEAKRDAQIMPTNAGKASLAASSEAAWEPAPLSQILAKKRK